MNKELFEKAKAAGSPEELLKLAHEVGMEDFTEENAKAYFESMHKSGELSDNELANASGGCKKGGRRIVTKGLVCVAYDFTDRSSYWQCKVCRLPNSKCYCNRGNVNSSDELFDLSGNFNKKHVCGSCQFCSYEKGVWYCNNENANRW